MTEKIVVLSGPFTDDEIAELVAVVQEIEARRPDETFHLILDDHEAELGSKATLERLAAINPLRSGYGRVILQMGDQETS